MSSFENNQIRQGATVCRMEDKPVLEKGIVSCFINICTRIYSTKKYGKQLRCAEKADLLRGGSKAKNQEQVQKECNP